MFKPYKQGLSKLQEYVASPMLSTLPMDLETAMVSPLPHPLAKWGAPCDQMSDTERKLVFTDGSTTNVCNAVHWSATTYHPASSD